MRAALALLPLLAASVRAADAPQAGRLQDIVIKAEESDELSKGKPPFELPFDPYESLRSTLKPDESQLLAEGLLLVLSAHTQRHGRPRTSPGTDRTARMLPCLAVGCCSPARSRSPRGRVSWPVSTGATRITCPRRGRRCCCSWPGREW